VSSKFLPESSLVVTTKGRRSDADRKYFSTERPMVDDIPLAVLVNRGSASASEIVTGAVQDLDRGIIVGTRTFGKGLVQTVTRLSDNTSLKVTTARYYTPSGRCIQEIDYSHRTKDGMFPMFADSVKREFRTSHNRKVLEGGGIDPDTLVADEEYSKLFVELNRKAMFFKYANRYAAERKSIPDRFDVDDGVLSDFERFLKERKFDYQEEAELRLRELRELAEKSRFGPEFFEQSKRMSSLVAVEKSRVIERYKQELKSALKTEIVGRMKGEKAKIETTFAADEQLRVAVNVLKDKRVYDRILAGKLR